jgi:anthranilate synthase component 2
VRILVIDNFDSFVYNLAQALGSLGAEPIVVRSDHTLSDLESLSPDGVVISPGPGYPADAGVSLEATRHFGSRVPVLGVCLGHQVIAAAFGASVTRATAGPVHGKSSSIQHSGTGLFDGLPSPMDAIRYHSLAVVEASVPDQLEITARSQDATIMGIRHKQLDVEGVQFHPESALTELGGRLLENYVARIA